MDVITAAGSFLFKNIHLCKWTRAPAISAGEKQHCCVSEANVSVGLMLHVNHFSNLLSKDPVCSVPGGGAIVCCCRPLRYEHSSLGGNWKSTEPLCGQTSQIVQDWRCQHLPFVPIYASETVYMWLVPPSCSWQGCVIEYELLVPEVSALVSERTGGCVDVLWWCRAVNCQL